MDLVAEVGSGDARRGLVAMRDLLAKRLESAGPRDAAALAGRLADVMDRLAALPVEAKGTVLDDLAARRSKPGRIAASPARSRRG